MRKFFPLYDFICMTLHPILLNFLINEEIFISFFISVGTKETGEGEEEFAVFLLSTTLFFHVTKICYNFRYNHRQRSNPFLQNLYNNLYI